MERKQIPVVILFGRVGGWDGGIADLCVVFVRMFYMKCHTSNILLFHLLKKLNNLSGEIHLLLGSY